MNREKTDPSIIAQILDYKLKYDHPNAYELALHVYEFWNDLTGLDEKDKFSNPSNSDFPSEVTELIKHYKIDPVEFVENWNKLKQ